MKKVIFKVSGRVQGVFFRKYTQQTALSLSLIGEARNLADGSVQVTAIGLEENLSKLESWLWKGSPMSKVSDVIEIERSEDTSFQHQDFLTR